MATKKNAKGKPTTLIQTLVPLPVGAAMKKLAANEGMSVAAYVRRLILVDLGPKFWKNRHIVSRGLKP